MYYPGQKNIPGLIHKIINQIPPCKYFCEPFAGSAAVSTFLSLLPGSNLKFFINDIDPYVTDKFDYPAGSTVTNLDAVNFLEILHNPATRTDAFIFMDPPYHHSTRPNNFKLYGTEMSHTDHVQFLEAATKVKSNCMIIHPACQLYDQALHEFRTIQLSVRYHNKTSIENLYMNYLDPEQLLTYVYAGKNCWDRQ
ncbi:unnamed protein product, partial [marine sediment metagenome]